MASIASLRQVEVDHIEDSQLPVFPEKLPPVFLVHTFADKVSGNAEKAKAAAHKVESSFDGKPYKANLVNATFIVDNTKAGKSSKEEGEEIKKLRKTVRDVTNELLRIKQAKSYIPLKWYQFEKEMLLKRAEGEVVIEFIEGKEIASKCGITDVTEMTTVLNYLHDRRSIIYFGESTPTSQQIFLSPQWLIEVFKKVITLRPKLSRIAKYRKHWEELGRTGTLSRELAQHEWKQLICKTRISSDKMVETVDILLNIMERFGLICRWQPLASPERYLVPSMLECLGSGAIESDVPPLFVRFESGQVPLGFFPRLAVQFINWFAKENNQDEDVVLKRNVITVSVSGFYTAHLVCLQSAVKVVVCRKECKDGATTERIKQAKSGSSACRRVEEFLRITLSEDSLKKKFPWNKAIAFGFYVMCNVCSDIKAKPICKHHQTTNCRRDECCHWFSEQRLRESKIRPITCTNERTHLQTNVSTECFAMWFDFLQEDSVSPAWWNKNLQQGLHPDHSEVYPMKKRCRGKAVILNNKNFEVERLPARHGSEVDVQKLMDLFSWLHFEVEVFEDLPGQEMLDYLVRYSGANHNNYDCFVACLMSHGEADDVILGTDDVEVKINDICCMFSNSNCITLRGKPKVFLVQACRGPTRDPGTEVRDSPGREYSNPAAGVPATQPAEQWNANFQGSRTIADRADVIVACASVEGYVSYRHQTKGSRFVNAVDEVFRERASYQDIVEMLTIVNSKVNETGGLGTKQIPEARSTLTKKLFFWPEFYQDP